MDRKLDLLKANRGTILECADDLAELVAMGKVEFYGRRLSE